MTIMNEKDLVRKIQILKKIEPRKDWVSLTKSRILEESAPAIEFKPQPVWGFFLKPAFVIPAALFLIAGGIFYFSNLKDLQVAQDEYQQKLTQLASLAPALGELQTNISQVRKSLDKIEVKNPESVLEIGKNVGLTTKTGEKILAETKKIAEATAPEKIADESQEQILASISETEKALGDLEESYQQKARKMVEYLIESAESQTLSGEDLIRLDEAEELYRAREYGKALEKILPIGNQ